MKHARPSTASDLVFFLVLFLVLPSALSAPAFAASSPQITSSSPIENFRLPLFNQVGVRTAFLQAVQAIIVSDTRIDAKTLHLTTYVDDGSGHVDCVLLSPAATAYTDKQVIAGPGFVHFTRDDVDVTGDVWTYFHKEKRVLIEHNAHVTFQDQLKDIIK